MQLLTNPPVALLTADPESLLRRQREAFAFFIPGRDSGRTRAIVTLIHGNEPSGIRAIHRCLVEQVEPECNCLIIVPSVAAAIIEPLYRNRVLPGERDLNRCFLPPYNDLPGQLAAEVLSLLQQYQPECVLDIHNTSGHSPAFGVVTYDSREHEALVSLFTPRQIVIDLRLGALMETSKPECPVVTIECGGAQDPKADEIAYAGVKRYLQQKDVLTLHAGQHLDLYRHPVRLELSPNTTIAFADSYVLGSDLTVPCDLEERNFGIVEPGTMIAWLKRKESVCHLKALTAQGEDRLQHFFNVQGNKLMTAQYMKLFMVTNRPDIALGDCLLYAVEASEHEIIDT